MTLRGRLTTAFLAVVLGPVLLGALFVGITVAVVLRDRADERLDRASATVTTAVGALCRQLQATADALAVLPDAGARQAAGDQIVARGLASTVVIDAAAAGRDCAEPRAGDDGGAVVARAEVRDADGAPVGTVQVRQGFDDALLARLAGTGGAAVTVLGSGSVLHSTEPAERRADVVAAVALTPELTQRLGTRYARALPPVPGQPLTLVVTVPGGNLAALYAVLAGAVVGAVALALLAATLLARSATRTIAEVAAAADRVAGGDLAARVPVLRPDELGRLAGSFNRMTQELQASVQALTASRDQLRRHLRILGDTLSGTHDLERILRVIVETAMAATGARAGVVLLVDPVTRTLVGRVGHGLAGRWEGEDVAALRLPVGAGLLGSVAATAEPRLGRAGDGTVPARGEPRGRTWVAVPICAPVLAPEDGAGAAVTLGVLALYDRLGADEFDDGDLDTLRTFASQAGVAVHNVRLHEEAQRLSLTDPLTGLWNYRSLQEASRREVERAHRFGRMLTVLALDLDHFKEVNDRYGHAAGDTVLVEFARRIRGCLREVDLAFRQGGEEFVVLLPETDAFGGATVAERLGAAVRAVPVAIGGRQADLVPISVSIGVAVYPDHGGSALRVLEAADGALYAAKAAGRDTYRLAEPVVPGAAPAAVARPDGRPADGAVLGAGGVTGAPGGPHPPRARRGR